jgi:hypothetical protein
MLKIAGAGVILVSLFAVLRVLSAAILLENKMRRATRI